MTQEQREEIVFSPPVVIEQMEAGEWHLSFGGSNPPHDEQVFTLPKEAAFGISKACQKAIQTVITTPSLFRQLNLRVDGEKLMTTLYAGRINGSKLMYLFEKDCWGIEEVEALEALVMECLTTEEKE